MVNSEELNHDQYLILEITKGFHDVKKYTFIKQSQHLEQGLAGIGRGRGVMAHTYVLTGWGLSNLALVLWVLACFFLKSYFFIF